MSNQKKSLPAFAVLTIICLVAALALAATNAITKGPIQEHAMAAQREAFGAVMAADEYIEMTIPEGSGVSALVEAKVNGETIGYCVVAAANGYAGSANPVAVTLGVDKDGKVTGAKIGDTSFAETSGFGSRWLADNKAAEFVGLDVQEGGAIEALTGATVTSNAVRDAANTALKAVSGVLGVTPADPIVVFGAAEKKPVEQMTLTGDIYEGSARGFASDVRVQLTKDASGAIAALAIESSGETVGFGTRCMEEPDFAQQFVGKTAPFAIGENIDALSGATVTSTAVVAAVNAAYDAPANPDAVPFGAETEEEAVVETVAEPLPEGALTASAKGLLSDVKVTVTLNEDGTIATLTVDASGETAAIAAPCTEEAFLSNFIGKAGPFEGVEVVSGATFTSNAVINAVNSLFPAAEEEAAGESLTGKAQGFQSEVTVTLTVDAGVITAIVVDSANETQGFGTRCAEDEAFLAQFIGKTAPVEVDALAGATVTSKAVVEAVNAALPAVETAPAGTAYEAIAKGFQSDVKVTVYADENGVITAIVVDSANETQGFGTRCAEDETFLAQFIGKKATPDLGEGIEVLSGATVTSKAVIEAANAAIGVSVAEVEIPAGTAYEATAKGFQSDVKVTVYADENGVITAIVVDSANETQGFGTRCAEDEAFLAQFVGKTAPVEVDALAGATVTSKAVVEAVNAALPAVETAPAGTAYEATAKGFQSDVKVTVYADDAGVITAIVVDSANETQGFGTRCAEDETFLTQFVGKTAPVEVDALAGATVTSKAVVEAVNAALTK